MTLVQVVEEIEYPENDGEPMGETDLHRNWMVRIHDMLRCRYRDQHVYVGSNLLVYYEEGLPYRYVVPDVFVVLNCPAGDRNTFKIWEEGIAPTVAFQVSVCRPRRTARSNPISQEGCRASRSDWGCAWRLADW